MWGCVRELNYTIIVPECFPQIIGPHAERLWLHFLESDRDVLGCSIFLVKEFANKVVQTMGRAPAEI